MENKNYINAYKTAENSMNAVKSSHEIIRELMFQLANSLERVVIDINEYTDDISNYKNTTKKEVALKKSKNMSRCLSIIYGLQTCLDFDKSPEIAGNLFQLYEFARQQVIKGFTQKDSVGVKQAMEVIREILNGWKEIPFEERKI
jgi:flagellar biosynthetic protein FliS